MAAVQSIIENLSKLDIRLEAIGDQINVTLPSNDDYGYLLDEVRKNKPAFLNYLRDQQCIEVPPAQGDQYSVLFEGEADIKRWALAEQTGLIHLTDKVKVRRHSGQCEINFRCAMPLEWLHDAITTASKQQYNAVMERIHKGEIWLKVNADNPRYEEHYARFTALFNNLRDLYNAINEPLVDPFMGYPGGMI